MVKRRSRNKIIPEIKQNLTDRIPQIDLLKGIAIISVVILHTWQPAIFLLFGAPYHIYHAVPILILIAGFTGAYAYKRYGSTTFKQCYDPSLIIRRFKRLLTPYIIFWVIQIILLVFILKNSFDGSSLIMNFISGGSGLGAYFIPVIFQSVFIIPLFYILAQKNPDLMVVVALILDIVFEVAMLFSGIPDRFYSLLYFRFIFAGALGVWLVMTPRRPVSWIAVGGLISLIYLTLSSYTNLFFSFSKFVGYDAVFHAPAYLWTLILVLTGLVLLPKNVKSLPFRWIERAGIASWHIFLVQMLYFLFVVQVVLNYIIFPLDKILPVGDFYTILLNLLGGVISVTFCCLVGYAWYIFENTWMHKKKAIANESHG